MIRRRLDRIGAREAIGIGLAIAGLAAVAAGAVLEADSTRWIGAALVTIAVAGGCWLAGRGLVAAALAQLLVVSTSIGRLAVLEGAVGLIVVGHLLASGLSNRTVGLATAGAVLGAGLAGLALLGVGLPVVAAGVALGAVLLAGLGARVAAVTLGGEPA